MTQNTDEQWQELDAAIERVGAKLQALHEGLADEEHLALHLILGQSWSAADPGDEVTGYAYVPPLRNLESVRLGLTPDHCSTGKVNPWNPSTWPKPPFTV